MRNHSAQSASVWMETAEVPAPAGLGENLEADVCVVGAGIAGISTAYMLAREGKWVVLLDAVGIGGGQTERTTAHLSNAIDDRYFEIERLHGTEGARFAAQSHTAAIDRIETVVREEGIDCDFERLPGYLFTPADEPTAVLDYELQAAHRAGLLSVHKAPAPVDALNTGFCLCFPAQAQFHPLSYLAGLARAIERYGGRIFTATRVTGIKGGRPARVETVGGKVVTAGAVVVATNTPINDRVAIHTKQAGYLTYVIAARVPRGSVPRALYWDTLDPYHYIRLHGAVAPSQPGMRTGEEHELLIVGGEDHKTGQANDGLDRWARLELWARTRFPMMETVAYRWSGQVMETVDGLAFIGRNPLDADNVYIATGDSGMGMTHGTIAGMLLTDLIVGRTNPWASLYDPSRKRVRAAWEYVKENINTAAQYADWLTGGELDSAQTLAPGSGAVIRHGLTKHAIYRDPEGVIHERSAVCPHLGGIVVWNSSEKTWDCPCHGSRFDCHGHVIQGPASSDLALVTDGEEALAGAITNGGSTTEARK